jgi:2-C-methyl-D-erythritol 4-phosphate cytidylyltransferase
MKSPLPKPFLVLRGGKTLLDASLAAFARVPGLFYTVVAARREHLDRAWTALKRSALAGRVVEGGREREDSVALALETVPAGIPLVLIHDAARPFVTAALVERVLEGAGRWGAVVPGVPVTDTIKLTGPEGRVVDTLPRARLAAVQTPQGFRDEVLRRAFRRIGRRRSGLTDDGAVAQAAGYPVRVVPGDPGNFKITTAEDLARARTKARTS